MSNDNLVRTEVAYITKNIVNANGGDINLPSGNRTRVRSGQARTFRSHPPRPCIVSRAVLREPRVKYG